MANITISSKEFGQVRGASRIEWRLYFDRPHRTASGKFRGVVTNGMLFSSKAYLRGDCAISAGKPTVPQIVVESTTDALKGSDVKCTLALFDKDNGRLIVTLFTDFEIPASPVSTTWPDLAVANIPAPPPAPTITAESADATTINVTINVTARADSYTLYRGTATGGPYTLVADDLPAGVYPDTGRTTGVEYFYVATATNGYGESDESAEASATPSAFFYMLLQTGDRLLLQTGDRLVLN